MNDKYNDFLKNKVVTIKDSGFDVDKSEINPYLFDWQISVVQWALKLGKAALFEECGLGKTLQYIEWSKHICKHTNGSVLICEPLAVTHQTIAEGKKIGVEIRYIRHQDEVTDNGVYTTNYDMLKEFDGSLWNGVVLDESSILKSYTGATKQMIIDMFESVPYKLACTATPAPNDHLELGNHAEFLNIMHSNEMIQRWFVNDSMQAGGYRLKKHGEKDYWKWVTSWAVCISKPSDIGYPDNCDKYSFDMPELIIKNEIVSVDHTRAWSSGQLFVDATLSATDMWREKKFTFKDRCDRVREVIAEGTWIIWCETNDEADYLVKLFPNSVEVRGSDSLKEKECKLNAFTSGEAEIIITKPDIAGFGLNWQHCNNMAFVGITYSFEKTYQALRRSWRFGQKKDVNAWMITSESEGEIMKSLTVKQNAHREMQRAMNEAMKTNGFGLTDHRAVKIDISERDETGDRWKLLLGDCVSRSKEIEDNSIDFSVYSPPFSNLYIYSDSIADMGNSADDEEFFEHYKFLISELFRVTKPGRLSAVHCKDLPLYHNRDGAAGLKDFPGMIIRAHEECGWTYHSRVTIWKDPVIEMQRTKNHGLLHKNFAVRSEVTRQGMADYVIVFRKWEGIEGTESAEPVKQNRKPGDYIGDNPPKSFDTDRDYSIQVWQRYASPVWFDINQTNVLNKAQARENADEKHICPLQLDVIARCVDLWTNKNDLVLSPFAGIGSEGFESIRLGRRFIGIELKESYFLTAVKNLKDAEVQFKSVDLFSNAGITLD
jgi:DNA modification methylase